MGWASGSFLFDEVITTLQEHLRNSDRQRWAIYVKLIRAFEAEDCDTLEECQGRDDQFDAALKFVREKEAP